MSLFAYQLKILLRLARWVRPLSFTAACYLIEFATRLAQRRLDAIERAIERTS
jgi:hypothetical protein